jgi:excinuclease ABC subunit A
MKETSITIRGARVHNLKNISLTIPHNKLIVITGVSGSGKSSLAYDTIFAEGQRRYVESLSSYARQFMGKMNKPDVDFINGIAPAIAIEQKVISRSSRSTVGTSTEIYDYLKLLFARIGKTYSPLSGNLVKRHSVTDVVAYLMNLKKDTQVTVLSPILIENTLYQQLELLQKQGFSRVEINGELKRIENLLEERPLSSKSEKKKNKNTPELFLVIDRFSINQEEEDLSNRMADSVQTAFYEGRGDLLLKIHSENTALTQSFSNRFELDGIAFDEPSVHLFNFNNPMGACRTCEGFGSVIGLDEKLIVPNPNLSVFEGAIACWKGEKMSRWKDELVNHSAKFNFPIHRPYFQLSKKEKEVVWTGNDYFEGLHSFFKFLEQESYKIQYRVMLSRYKGKTHCPECFGTRLRKESTYVKIAEKTIGEITLMQVKDSLPFFQNLSLAENEKLIAKRLLLEITTRLQFLNDVGLGYLTLNRLSNTLSGGESQRINLATSLGSSLVGSLYVLDEPSIGLHPNDTQRLIKVLQSLRNLGNTVLVVEHDEEIMHAADEIIDLGPGAGTNGGTLVFQGRFQNLKEADTSTGMSHTVNYLTGKDSIAVPLKRRKWKNFIQIKGIRENNLKNITVKFPLHAFTVVTGVSGSGKTSLVKKVLHAGLTRTMGGYTDDAGSFDLIEGDVHKISSVEIVDQNPIGKSSRSNPVTYIKAYDEIRNFYALLPLAKTRYYKPSAFSFNVAGGRCETCEGEGEVTIEMQFMADVHLACETCKGKRFKNDILEVMHQNKNIADVLNMTVDEAVAFFAEEKKIQSKLKLLQEVGMGYITLGQSSSTLSGGEAQRVKLATFLSEASSKTHHEGTLFIFDEPTTGLHFHDIKKLLYALNRLVDEGNTLVVIEHNTDVIKCADYVIDLGPEGGDEGGNLIFEGTPEGLAKCKESLTGNFLKGKL